MNKSEIRVLSIDGGGIRGLIPSVILDHVEKMIGVPISTYFDIIIGTSTGGLLTLCLTSPDKNDRSKPKYTAEDVVHLYERFGREIFKKNVSKTVLGVFGLLSSVYSNKNFIKILDEYFSATLFSELISCPIVTSYDIQKNSPHFFKQMKYSSGLTHSSLEDYLVADVALATSAAPVFFSPANIKSTSDVEYRLIDGGVAANNPAMCGYAEARRLFPNKAIRIFSLSCGGKKNKDSNVGDVFNGLVSWGPSIVNIFMDGSIEAVDYQLKRLSNEDSSLSYMRINPTLTQDTMKMDDASDVNIKRLKDIAMRELNDKYKDIERFLI